MSGKKGHTNITLHVMNCCYKQYFFKYLYKDDATIRSVYEVFEYLQVPPAENVSHFQQECISTEANFNYLLM